MAPPSFNYCCENNILFYTLIQSLYRQVISPFTICYFSLNSFNYCIQHNYSVLYYCLPLFYTPFTYFNAQLPASYHISVKSDIINPSKYCINSCNGNFPFSAKNALHIVYISSLFCVGLS